MIKAVLEDSRTAGSARLLLIVLAEMAGDDGRCWPSVGLLRKRMNIGTDRAVQSLLKTLEDTGLIAREMRTGHSTMYRVLLQGGEAQFTTEHSFTPEAQFTPELCFGGEAQFTRGVKHSSPGGCSTVHQGGEAQFTQNRNRTVSEPLLNLKANDEQESEWNPGYPEPIPMPSARRERQPFQTKSQAQEQNKRRAKVFGWIYTAINGQELESVPSPGTLKKYEEALDWFLSNSITPEQICIAAAAAKAKWRNIENLSVAINPKSLANNWHSLYTPQRTPAAPTIKPDEAAAISDSIRAHQEAAARARQMRFGSK